MEDNGRVETYDEWKRYVTGANRRSMYWKTAGDWFYPTVAANAMFNGKMFHICEANWRLDNDGIKSHGPTAVRESCNECGTEIPDGIKMIALLLSW